MTPYLWPMLNQSSTLCLVDNINISIAMIRFISNMISKEMKEKYVPES